MGRRQDVQCVAQRFKPLLYVENLGVELGRLLVVKGVDGVGDRHLDLVDEFFDGGHDRGVPATQRTVTTLREI